MDKDFEIKQALIKHYLKNIVYHNSYFNKYEVEVKRFYNKLENLDKRIPIKLGTIILFKDFPLVDIKNEENDVAFKEHYFVVLGRNNDEVFLAYTTTKIDKYQNNNYKNNNYLIFHSTKYKKKFLISLRKIFIMKKDFLIEEIKKNTCLINKTLNKVCNFYLKLFIVNTELYNVNFKKFMRNTFNIKRSVINYNIIEYKDLKNRNDEEKKELYILFLSEFSPIKMINF